MHASVEMVGDDYRQRKRGNSIAWQLRNTRHGMIGERAEAADVEICRVAVRAVVSQQKCQTLLESNPVLAKRNRPAHIAAMKKNKFLC